jgi:opacity protein-like surface antigen
MKCFLATLSLLTITLSGAPKCKPVSAAPQCCSQPKDCSFYIKVGSGISFSESAKVIAPSSTWTPAIQGYNAKLGNCPIASLSVGCELFQVMDLEVNISNRSTFKYKKFQTPTTGGGSYTRRFDLNVTPILFAANLLGRGIPYFHWNIGCSRIYPVMGVGLGVSNLLITNYRTTGLPPTGSSSPHASFSAENQYTLRKNFTYTLLAGLEYSYKNYWAIGTGYRWFNAGHFKGPRYQRVASGSAVDVDGDEWKMRFRSNEWFIEFKIFI